MNKKGTIIHFIAFGLLIAIGVFLWMTEEVTDLAPDIKGKWQVDFLRDNFLEAEKELLKTDAVVKNIGTGVASQLAENAGFKPGTSSECGKSGNVKFWNKDSKWCFVYDDVKNTVAELILEKLDQKIEGHNFTNINFNGSFLTGDGDKAEIVTENAKYIYDTSFAVNLGYSFEDYKQLELDAHKLVDLCRKESDLKACLDKIKLNYWRYGACGNEVYSGAGKVVKFCAASPGLGYLPSDDGQKLVAYEIALDFN